LKNELETIGFLVISLTLFPLHTVNLATITLTQQSWSAHRQALHAAQRLLVAASILAVTLISSPALALGVTRAVARQSFSTSTVMGLL
jgi:hypothetical protein